MQVPLLGEVLEVAVDARKNLDVWGSRAADAGTAQRDARAFMSRVLNRLDTELALTQAAAMLPMYQMAVELARGRTVLKTKP